MRWFWIDRFTEFLSGQHAVAVKGVSLAEEHLHSHFPGYPVMPPSLVIEGLAQTGGLLFGEHLQFASPVVLAKVSRAKFIRHAHPGDQLVYRAELASVMAEGAKIKGTAHVGNELYAEIDLFLGVLAGKSQEMVFDFSVLAGLLRILGVLEVGRTAQGDPIQLPPRMLEAEYSSPVV